MVEVEKFIKQWEVWVAFAGIVLFGMLIYCKRGWGLIGAAWYLVKAAIIPLLIIIFYFAVIR